MPPWTPRTLWRFALALWCTSVALGLVAGAPLTSDEASYALIARGGGHDWIYRPVGMVALAKVGAWLGGGDVAMRLPCALTSPLLLVAIAAVGRTLGRWPGVIAAAVVAGTHT